MLEKGDAASDVEVRGRSGRGVDAVQGSRVARHPKAAAGVDHVRVGVSCVDVDGKSTADAAVADLDHSPAGIDRPDVSLVVAGEVAADLARLRARSHRSGLGIERDEGWRAAVARDPHNVTEGESRCGARDLVGRGHGVRRRVDSVDGARVERHRPHRVGGHRETEQLRAADVDDALHLGLGDRRGRRADRGRCGSRRRRGGRARCRSRGCCRGRRCVVGAPGDRDADSDGHERSSHTHRETLAQQADQSGSIGTAKPGSWPS